MTETRIVATFAAVDELFGDEYEVEVYQDFYVARDHHRRRETRGPIRTRLPDGREVIRVGNRRYEVRGHLVFLTSDDANAP